MKRTNMLPELLLFLSGITALMVSFADAVEVHQACRGTSNARQCSQHRLQCKQGSIFILEAARGFKLRSSRCHTMRKSCNDRDRCCQHTWQDCLEDYTRDAFLDLAAKCLNKVRCTYRIPKARRASCNRDYQKYSGYSVVHYMCVHDQVMKDFRDFRATTATSMALRYRFSADTRDYVCRVEAEDCSTRTVDVTLIRSPIHQVADSCTRLLVNDKSPSCHPSQTPHATFSVPTPASVSLHINKRNDVRQAWAVIRGRNSSMLQITCQTRGSLFPGCIPPTTSSTTHITSSKTNTTSSTMHTASTTMHAKSTMMHTMTSNPSETTLPSSPKQTAGPSAMTEAALTAVPQSSPSSISARATSSAAMVDDGEQSPGFSSTAGMVGAVLGSMAVVAVVVALSVVFFLDKCRHFQGKDSFKIMTCFKGGNSSSPRPRQSPTAMTPPSGRAESDVKPGEPTSLPTYLDITTATTTGGAVGYEDQGSPYNHLRQKHMSPAPRDVIYSHLAGGKYVNENDYDHLEVGKKTGRFGDVSNNVYETVGPPDTGSSDRDACFITDGAQRGW